MTTDETSPSNLQLLLDEAVAKFKSGASISGLDGCGTALYYRAVQVGFEGNMRQWVDRVGMEIAKESGDEHSL